MTSSTKKILRLYLTKEIRSKLVSKYYELQIFSNQRKAMDVPTALDSLKIVFKFKKNAI